MAGTLGVVALWLLFALMLKVLFAAMLGGLGEWRSWRWLADHVRPVAPPPPVRDLAQVAADARRIADRYHRDGLTHVQLEGRRQAFDRVLGEVAGRLEVDHLLGVLPPGPEQDRERDRLEAVMARYGVLAPRPGRDVG